MIRFTHYKEVPYPVDKIYRLYSVLLQGPVHYDQLLLSTDNKKIKDILIRLTLTSNKFALELSSRIAELELILLTKAGITEPPVSYKPFDCEGAALECFCALEKTMISTYRDVLNEPFANTPLRQMLNFQLSEMLYLFMHLKLMNSLKVKMY